MEKSRDHKFICRICDKGFIFKSSYESHIQTHVGPLFQCDNCAKRFTLATNLRRHKRSTHETPGAKSKCKSCGESFSNRNLLRCHIRHTHTVKTVKIKSDKCIQCGKMFSTTRTLKEHIKKFHSYKRLNDGKMTKDPIRNEGSLVNVSVAGINQTGVKLMVGGEEYRFGMQGGPESEQKISENYKVHKTASCFVDNYGNMFQLEELLNLVHPSKPVSNTMGTTFGCEISKYPIKAGKNEIVLKGHFADTFHNNTRRVYPKIFVNTEQLNKVTQMGLTSAEKLDNKIVFSIQLIWFYNSTANENYRVSESSHHYVLFMFDVRLSRYFIFDPNSPYCNNVRKNLSRWYMSRILLWYNVLKLPGEIPNKQNVTIEFFNLQSLEMSMDCAPINLLMILRITSHYDTLANGEGMEWTLDFIRTKCVLDKESCNLLRQFLAKKVMRQVPELCDLLIV